MMLIQLDYKINAHVYVCMHAKLLFNGGIYNLQVHACISDLTFCSA